MDERTCAAPGCHTTFVSISVNRKYCGRRCARRVENARYRNSRPERSYCKNCGLGFQHKRGQTNKLYCSLDCQYEARSLDYAERGIRPPNVAAITTPIPTRSRVSEVTVGALYKVIRRDPCAYCGGPAAHLDHIVPRASGGPNHWANYTAACATCNASKSNKSLLMFLGWRSAARDFVAWSDAAGNTEPKASIVSEARQAVLATGG